MLLSFTKPGAGNKQQGATMIEVMVALFLLAIGLLGMLSLQNTSQRSNQSAMFSSVAVVLARDMANRIIANDDSSSVNDDAIYDDIDTNDVTGTTTECTANCNQGAVLEMDKGQWAQAIRTQLPAGRGMVDVNGNGVHMVTVMWDDQRTGATGTDCSGNAENDLTCVRLEFRL